MRALYATDTSVYRELPRAVIYPRSSQDVGVVMDVSVYLNRVLEVDEKNR